VRVGRQELAYGAGRLIAPREGPNERQPFDAARILLTSGTGGPIRFMDAQSS